LTRIIQIGAEVVRLSGRAGQRIWLGKAVQRASLSGVMVAITHRAADRPLPQHFRGGGGLETTARRRQPAAVCRKVAMAQDGSEVEILGDGKQTRSFLYVDECLTARHG